MIHCRHLQWGAAGQPLTPPLDLDLPAGSLTAIIGHNGCGKSSLLKVIAGLQKPLAGRLQVNAQDLGSVAYLQQQQNIDRQFSAAFTATGQRRPVAQQVVSAGATAAPKAGSGRLASDSAGRTAVTRPLRW